MTYSESWGLSGTRMAIFQRATALLTTAEVNYFVISSHMPQPFCAPFLFISEAQGPDDIDLILRLFA